MEIIDEVAGWLIFRPIIAEKSAAEKIMYTRKNFLENSKDWEAQALIKCLYVLQRKAYLYVLYSKIHLPFLTQDTEIESRIENWLANQWASYNSSTIC